MTTRYRMRPDDGNPRHGTVNGYNNVRCRCDDCRDAWAKYVQRRRAASATNAAGRTS